MKICYQCYCPHVSILYCTQVNSAYYYPLLVLFYGEIQITQWLVTGEIMMLLTR